MAGRAGGRHQVDRMAILAACIAVMNAVSAFAAVGGLGMR